jgi:apolipoprotein N-acyltransferase
VLDRALLPLAASYACLIVLGVPVAEFVRESRPARASDRSILILQPRLPAGDRWIPDLQQTNVALLSRRTLSALTSAGERPDLIVWPETSITVDLRQVPDVKDELDRWLALLDTDLLLGGVTSAGETERYRNTAIWVSPAGTVLDQVDKTRAVPFVERAPTTRIEGWLRTLMGAGSIDRLVREGTEQRPLRSTNAYAVAFCYEVLYPQLVAARTDDDVLAILNLANDAWYGSATPGQQQLAFATFRAIEQRRHVIRVADSGPSGVVDSYGRIVSRLPPSEMGTLFARITPSVPPLARERVAIPALALCGGLIGLLAARLASHPWRRTRAPAPRT